MRVIHHNDCTWCQHRIVYKRVKSSGEIERCGLTNALIKGPYERGRRLCDNYQQKECECEQCNTKITNVAY